MSLFGGSNGRAGAGVPDARCEDVKVNRNRPWTDEDVVELKRMLAEGADFPAIGRALKRHQTGVASQVFSLKAQDVR